MWRIHSGKQSSKPENLMPATLIMGHSTSPKQLKLSLGKLGITIRHAPRASGKSKGKCEKFHQVVDSYLREAKAHQIRTLEQLNQYWGIFLEEYYHKKPHEGLREYYESLGQPVPAQGISPLQEWGRDSRPPDIPGYRCSSRSISPPRDPSGRQRRVHQLPGQEI